VRPRARRGPWRGEGPGAARALARRGPWRGVRPGEPASQPVSEPASELRRPQCERAERAERAERPRAAGPLRRAQRPTRRGRPSTLTTSGRIQLTLPTLPCCSRAVVQSCSPPARPLLFGCSAVCVCAALLPCCCAVVLLCYSLLLLVRSLSRALSVPPHRTPSPPHGASSGTAASTGCSRRCSDNLLLSLGSAVSAALALLLLLLPLLLLPATRAFTTTRDTSLACVGMRRQLFLDSASCRRPLEGSPSSLLRVV
jgi:hypothetical protein